MPRFPYFCGFLVSGLHRGGELGKRSVGSGVLLHDPIRRLTGGVNRRVRSTICSFGFIGWRTK